QADIYGCDVHMTNSSEGPAFGVALLAQVGTGGFSSVPEACDATIRVVDSTQLDPKVKPFYDRAFAVYRPLYIDLRKSFHTISRLVHEPWIRQGEGETERTALNERAGGRFGLARKSKQPATVKRPTSGGAERPTAAAESQESPAAATATAPSIPASRSRAW